MATKKDFLLKRLHLRADIEQFLSQHEKSMSKIFFEKSLTRRFVCMAFLLKRREKKETYISKANFA